MANMISAMQRTTAPVDPFAALFLWDVLFLPVPPGLPVPLSVLLLPVWLVTKARLYGRHLVLAAVIAACGAVFSLMFSLIAPGAILSKAVINTGVFLYLLLGLVLFASSTPPRLLLNLKAYIAFVAALAGLFFIDYQTYFMVRSSWTMSGNLIEVDALSTSTRFTGTMSDPNNMAVMAVAVLAFILFRQEQRIVNNLVVVVATAVIVIATMSTTGLILLVSVTMFYTLHARVSRSFGANIVVRAMIIGVAVVGLFFAYQAIQDNRVVMLALERASEATIETRLSNWSAIFDLEHLLETLVLGYGGVVIWGDEVFSPHNGHLHVIFSFGVIAYLAFIAAAFPFPYRRIAFARDSRRYLFLAVILVGFTVNVGIYEPRYSGLWAILVGYLYIENRARAYTASASPGTASVEGALPRDGRESWGGLTAAPVGRHPSL